MEAYLDPRGPLDPGWRKSTSVRNALAPE
jgi:hypothetical protein